MSKPDRENLPGDVFCVTCGHTARRHVQNAFNRLVCTGSRGKRSYQDCECRSFKEKPSAGSWKNLLSALKRTKDKPK